MEAGAGPQPTEPPLPPGGTATAAAAQDWAATPLGPREHWPQSLKTAASDRARQQRADVPRAGVRSCG